MHTVGRYGRYRTAHESRDWHQSVCGVARILECRLVREPLVGRFMSLQDYILTNRVSPRVYTSSVPYHKLAPNGKK